MSVGSNICSVAYTENLATGSRCAVPLSAAFHQGREFLSFTFYYYYFFFFGSLLFLCAIFKVFWKGKQPAVEVEVVGGALFFLDVQEAGKGLTLNHFLCPSCASSPEGPDFVSLADLPQFRWGVELVFVQVPNDH